MAFHLLMCRHHLLTFGPVLNIVPFSRCISSDEIASEWRDPLTGLSPATPSSINCRHHYDCMADSQKSGHSGFRSGAFHARESLPRRSHSHFCRYPCNPLVMPEITSVAEDHHKDTATDTSYPTSQTHISDKIQQVHITPKSTQSDGDGSGLSTSRRRRRKGEFKHLIHTHGQIDCHRIALSDEGYFLENIDAWKTDFRSYRKNISRAHHLKYVAYKTLLQERCAAAISSQELPRSSLERSHCIIDGQRWKAEEEATL